MKGFTLVEILGVIAVISILTVVALLGVGLSRCTILEQAANRELQTLNSAYQHYLGAGGVAPQSNDPLDALEAMALPVNGMGPFIQHGGNALEVFDNVCNSPVPVTFDPPTGFSTPGGGSSTPDPNATPEGVPPSPLPTSSPTPTPTPTPAPTPTPVPASITLVVNPTIIVEGEVSTFTVNIQQPEASGSASFSLVVPSGVELESASIGSIVGNNLVWSGSSTPTLQVTGLVRGITAGNYSLTANYSDNGGAVSANSSLVVVAANMVSEVTASGRGATGNIGIRVSFNYRAIGYMAPIPSPPGTPFYRMGHHIGNNTAAVGWGGFAPFNIATNNIGSQTSGGSNSGQVTVFFHSSISSAVARVPVLLWRRVITYVPNSSVIASEIWNFEERYIFVAFTRSEDPNATNGTLGNQIFIESARVGSVGNPPRYWHRLSSLNRGWIN